MFKLLIGLLFNLLILGSAQQAMAKDCPPPPKCPEGTTLKKEQVNPGVDVYQCLDADRAVSGLKFTCTMDVLTSEEHYDQGIPIGVHKKWHPKGTRYSQGYYDDAGRKIRAWKVWDEEGRLTNLRRYENGFQHGLQTTFHPATKRPKEQLLFLEGVLQGFGRTWDERGQIRSQIIYVNGQPRGIYRRWHPNGALSEQGWFGENGMKQGVWHHWHSNRELQITENFEDGLRVGDFEELDEDGELTASGYYVAGNRDGLWFEKTFTGRSETEYREGRINGVQKMFSPSRLLVSEELFRDNKREGQSSSFHPNGLLKEHGAYQHGSRVGVWKTLDDEGALVRQNTYDRKGFLSEECILYEGEMACSQALTWSHFKDKNCEYLGGQGEFLIRSETEFKAKFSCKVPPKIDWASMNLWGYSGTEPDIPTLKGVESLPTTISVVFHVPSHCPAGRQAPPVDFAYNILIPADTRPVTPRWDHGIKHPCPKRP